jgi:hypothetical protein
MRRMRIAAITSISVKPAERPPRRGTNAARRRVEGEKEAKDDERS